MRCSKIGYCPLFVIGCVVLVVGAGGSNLHGEAPDSESGEFTYGAWKVFCENGFCASAYQYGRGGSMPTFIRVKLSEEGYPEILVEGGPFHVGCMPGTGSWPKTGWTRRPGSYFDPLMNDPGDIMPAPPSARPGTLRLLAAAEPAPVC